MTFTWVLVLVLLGWSVVCSTREVSGEESVCLVVELSALLPVAPRKHVNAPHEPHFFSSFFAKWLDSVKLGR